MQRRLVRLSRFRIILYSNVPYIVSVFCIGSFLLSNTLSNECFATTTASLTITTGGVNQDISKPINDSSTVMPGNVAYSKEYIVNVNASSIESYTLKISGNTNLTGPTGSTAIVGAANKTPANMTNNTWGYGWGDTTASKESLAYQTLTNTNGGTGISVGNVSNNAINSSKKLVFAAKFADTNTNSGHYTASVNLSLVATPKSVSLSGITKMQEMTSEICTASSIGETNTLTDSRDSKTYSVRKMADGKCWMTQNLKLINKTISASNNDSDMASGSFTIPSSNESGFTSANEATPQAYLGTSSDGANANGTGYYNYYTATAGTGTSSTGGDNAPSSICPKGWKLPTGLVTGNNTTNDFYNLFNSMDKSIFANGTLVAANSASGYTVWAEPQADSLAKVTGSPYNFGFAGYVHNGSLKYVSSAGHWWSSTVRDSTSSYFLGLSSGSVYPGTYDYRRLDGFPVRCLAR